MTRESKINRNRRSTPGLFGSGCYLALFLISGLIPQLTGPGTSGFGTAVPSNAGAPLSEDPVPSGSPFSQPVEDHSPDRAPTALGHTLSARLARAGGHALPTAILPVARRKRTARPGIRLEHAGPPSRVSGRALRHWLQSQTC